MILVWPGMVSLGYRPLPNPGLRPAAAPRAPSGTQPLRSRLLASRLTARGSAFARFSPRASARASAPLPGRGACRRTPTVNPLGSSLPLMGRRTRPPRATSVARWRSHTRPINQSLPQRPLGEGGRAEQGREGAGAVPWPPPLPTSGVRVWANNLTTSGMIHLARGYGAVRISHGIHAAKGNSRAL